MNIELRKTLNGTIIRSSLRHDDDIDPTSLSYLKNLSNSNGRMLNREIKPIDRARSPVSIERIELLQLAR